MTLISFFTFLEIKALRSTILVVSAVKLWEHSRQKKRCFLNLRKAGKPETGLSVILEVRVPFLTIEKLRFTQPQLGQASGQ